MQRVLALILLAILSVPSLAQNRQEQRDPSATNPQVSIDGLFPLKWDARAGKMTMQISRFNREFLYQISLPAGVGSNPIGLDRGQLGESHIVFFERIGSKVLLVKPNYEFRALTNHAAERRAVEESFARSIIWGFKIESETPDAVTVDVTSFFLRDAHGVADRLRSARQGNYRFDESRSAFYLPRTKGFPRNTEVETIITVTSDGEAGPLIRQVAPSSQAISVREHHSFVELPDATYHPRTLDPRVGISGITFYDYASPFTEPIEKRWISRHRLQKKDPNAGCFRSCSTHRLLRRQRCARTHPDRSRRGSIVVGRSLRGGWLQECLRRQGAPRRCRSDGHPLQHDQLGSPFHARVVIRCQRR
jgi:hypothetical protein